MLSTPAMGTLPASIMRRITKIDINESVSRHKLIFQEEWLDKFDRFVVYIFFSGLIIYPALTIFEADFNNPNDKFISLTILPLCILFGLYVVYRKATEKLLFTLTTPFDRQKNKQILLTYADKQQLEVYRKSNDCLILNESLGDFNPSYKKSMVFILKDNEVLFTILKDQYKLNLPTLTSHLFLKHDLKKLFKNVLTNESGLADR
jgi:hypothetical protein